MKAKLVSAVALAWGVVMGCSGGEAARPGEGAEAADGGGASTGGLPCDVDAVLAKNCRQCHAASPKFGAPMPLETLADLIAPAKSDPGKKVYELIGARVHDDAAPMPPPPNERLSAADLATLDSWIAAGAPAGTVECAPTTTDPAGVDPLPCTPDQKLRPTSKYTMGQETDEYVCYGFDTDSSVKRHVIAGAPRVDNTKIVHHILLYQADQTVSGTPTKCGAGGASGWRLVTGWAPGGKNFELPPEAGLAEEAGTTHWALQIHYNNAQGLVGESDESGYDLCTTEQLRPNDADILATGTAQIDIPPRSTHTATCDFEVPATFGSITVVSSWPHMHKLGRSQYAKRVRGGEETMILDEPNYDFTLGGTAGDVRVELAGGDTVRTQCRWQNTGDTAVKFGEGTGDEMCFAFLTYYPKVPVSGFHWALPSAPRFSKCTTTTE